MKIIIEMSNFLLGDYGYRTCFILGVVRDYLILKEYDTVNRRVLESYYAVRDGDEPIHANDLADLWPQLAIA